MIGRLARRRSLLIGRRLQSGPAGQPPVAEGEWNPKVKLAFQLAAPVLAAAAFTGTVVWNPSFRYFLEGYAPGIVDLVRRKIGFADEDPVERKRVADLLALQAQPVEMIVHTIDGQIERVKVDGQSSFAEAYAAAAHDQSTPPALGAFEFVDTAPGSAALDNFSEPAEVANLTTTQDLGPRSLQNIVDRESDDKYSIRVANSVKDLWSLEPAEWAQAAQQASPAAVEEEEESAKPRKKTAVVTATKQPKAKSAAEIEKEAAQQKISELQLFVQQLEEEKAFGTRSIDDIDQDIANAKQEIAQLKRKYINWFYFF